MTPEAEFVGARGAAPAVRCWSTQDVQARDALSYWCDSIGQVMLELDIEAADNAGFSAQLDQYSLGPATANFLQGHGWQRGAGWDEGEPNFAAILQWNRAPIYAKTVALFADRLAGR